MPSNHLILCHPLLLPSIFPSIRVFSNESVLRIRWPKYCSFSFNISPSNEYSGLISFRMDCLDLLVVQGTLKSLLQHHSSKASILQCSAFFIVQLSHPYMTTEKTIAFTRQTFVFKLMPLLFNMLSRLVITFLPRNRHLLISWLQSQSPVILELSKIKSLTVSIVSIYLPWSDETRCHSPLDSKEIQQENRLGKKKKTGNQLLLHASCWVNLKLQNKTMPTCRTYNWKSNFSDNSFSSISQVMSNDFIYFSCIKY